MHIVAALQYAKKDFCNFSKNIPLKRSINASKLGHIEGKDFFSLKFWKSSALNWQ